MLAGGFQKYLQPPVSVTVRADRVDPHKDGGKLSLGYEKNDVPGCGDFIALSRSLGMRGSEARALFQRASHARGI